MNGATRVCQTCGYCLDHLEAPRCPECGRSFDPRDPRTYDGPHVDRGWRALYLSAFPVPAFAFAAWLPRTPDPWAALRPMDVSVWALAQLAIVAGSIVWLAACYVAATDSTVRLDRRGELIAFGLGIVGVMSVVLTAEHAVSSLMRAFLP